MKNRLVTAFVLSLPIMINEVDIINIKVEQETPFLQLDNDKTYIK